MCYGGARQFTFDLASLAVTARQAYGDATGQTYSEKRRVCCHGNPTQLKGRWSNGV